MRTTPIRLLASAVILAATLLALAACSSGAPAATKTRAVPLAALATPSPTPTPSETPTKEDLPFIPIGPFNTAAQAKELFVALVKNYCAPAYENGNQPPVDPKKATVHRGPTKNEWLVTDKAGDKIVLNTASNRVYSTDGPGGMLPGDYTFGCDGVVFPGTWD